MEQDLSEGEVSMTWVAVAVVAVVLVVGAVLLRRRGRGSGTPGTPDVRVGKAGELDAHVARTQHQGNIYGAGGGGLPL